MLLLAHFEAILDFSRSNLLAHNNLWLCYYEQVKTFGDTIYFDVDGT